MRFGLALSGGALRGAAHIGALRALEEHNLFPSLISGTSAGSMVAALYSFGYSTDDMEKFALSIDRSMIDVDLFGAIKEGTKWVCTKQFDLGGAVKGNKLEKMMKELTCDKLITSAKIPVAITSVDINNGNTVIFVSHKSRLKNTKYEVYFDNVPIYEAVRASIAIPVVFRPKMIYGMRLVDGGVTVNLPISVLKEMGAKKVLGINLGYSGQRRSEVNNLLEIGNQAIDIMAYKITRYDSIDADCVINPQIYDVGLLDINKIPECIERGYESIINNIDMIKKSINS